MPSPSQIGSRIAVVIVAVLIAGLGVMVGARLRGGKPVEILNEETLVLPDSIRPGRPFPQALVTGEDGVETTTKALLVGRGGVVILIDTECHPCSLMTTRVQHLID